MTPVPAPIPPALAPASETPGESASPSLGASEALRVDLDLVRKYNVPGPRYTSYPPATHFSGAVSPEQIIEGIRANNRTARELSLYFHLPFCYSLCWYCGCTTVITPQQSQSATYLKYLDREMELMGRLLHPEQIGRAHV